MTISVGTPPVPATPTQLTQFRADLGGITDVEVAVVRAGGQTLLRNTSGQTLLGIDSQGNVTCLTPAVTGTLKRTSPVLYRTSQGVVSRIAGFQAAVGFGGKVIAVDNNGTFWRYTVALGWLQISAIGVIPDTVSIFFADSRGNLFYAPNTGAILYRSTDGGATWAASMTMPGSTDNISPMCEDDLGNLYVGAYGGSSGAAVGFNNGLGLNSRKVYKSIDGGGTWVEISVNFPANGGGFTGPAGINRHIHGCWWDNYRKLLFVTHGDAGDTSTMYASGDRGSSFSVWAASAQATAMAFTPSHVLYASDLSGDRRVYRRACSSLATLLAGPAAVCWDWISQGGLGSNGSTMNGFAWQGFADDQGNVVFSFGIEGTRTSVIASGDSGDSWGELVTQNGPQRTFHDFVQVSPFNTSRDGFQYGFDSKDGPAGSLSQWRVYKMGSVLTVGGNKPDYQSSGVSAPMPGFMLGALRSPGVLQSLAANITTPVLMDAPYMAIGRAGFQLGALVVAQSLVAEPWEGTPTGWTNSLGGTGVITQNDTTRAKTGTQSLKADLGAGPAVSNAWVRRTAAPWGRTLVDGDEVWFVSNVWLTAITASRLGVLEFGSTRITAVTSDGVNKLRVFNATLGIDVATQAANEGIAMPIGQWVRVKVAITLGSTATVAGRVRVWQDIGTGYRLVLDVLGIPTYSGAVPANYFIGAETGNGGNFTVVWHDDVRFGLNDDPEMPPALTMNNAPQSVFSDGLFL